MKVILISSPGLRPLEIYQSIGLRAPPLGLAYIASILERAGYKVRIVDAPTLGLTIKHIINCIKRFKPDVIGISSVTPTAKAGYIISRLTKREYDRDVPIVMGGPHVTYMYREALTVGKADYVVRGEGEYTMLELMDYLSRGKPSLNEILGLAYKDRYGNVFRNKGRPLIRNLDELPEPARHLLSMDHYTLFDKPVKIIHVMASRGCPYGCIYCTTSYYWGRRYRIRSPEKVVNEIERCMNKYKTNIVAFTDDELTLNKGWIMRFTKEIIDRGLDIVYTCGSRVNNVDREVLARLSKTGCSMIYYGIESCNDRDLSLIRKGITTRQIEKALSLTKKYGIETTGSFILGFPWQTINDMRNIVKFAIKLDVDYAQFTVATPYPGTPLYYYAKRCNLIESYDWDDYTTIKPVMRGLYFTREVLSKLIGWAYRSFYLRPKYIFKNMLKGRLKTVGGVILNIVKKYLT